jgi:curved DNA-binding protein CbpA
MSGSDTVEIKSKYAGRDFYEVFGVVRDVPLKDVQRAYRALALKVHPDRNGNSPESIRDFQELSRMMEILSDPKRRSDYDNFGDIHADVGASAEHWQTVFRKVTKEDIESYETKYLGSEEEVADVLHFYQKFEGNCKKMLEWIPLSNPSYIVRYEKIITDAVATKKVKFFPKWNSAKTDAEKHRKKYAGEEEEAKQLLQTITAKYTPFLPPPDPTEHEEDGKEEEGDEEEKEQQKAKRKSVVVRDAEQRGVLASMGDGLVASMRAREIARHQAMVRSLEEKYGNRKRKNKSHKRLDNDLPSEEEFQRIQKQLDRQRAQRQTRPNIMQHHLQRQRQSKKARHT